MPVSLLDLVLHLLILVFPQKDFYHIVLFLSHTRPHYIMSNWKAMIIFSSLLSSVPRIQYMFAE